MAVGEVGSRDALAEMWNGSTWSVLPTAIPGLVAGAGVLVQYPLLSVSCTSPTACMAVGLSQYAQASTTLAEMWNGATWTVVASPNADNAMGGINQLLGVSCSSGSACTAVGWSRPAGRPDQNLIETFNGATWSIAGGPNSALAGKVNVLEGVSCPAAGACTAVGWFNAGTRIQGLIETLTPSGWAILAGAPVTHSLFGVSCTSATACTAVGFANLTESWAGSGWTVGTPPADVASHLGELRGVSCVAFAGCQAVGYFKATATLHQTLGEAGGPPTVSVSSGPVTVDHQAGGPLALNVAVSSPSALTGATLKFMYAPLTDLSASQRSAVVTVPAVPANQKTQVPVPTFTVAPVVAAGGQTIPGLQAWSAPTTGWSVTGPTSLTPAGGNLVFSDEPEYLDSKTQTGGGSAGGPAAEGVLYKQTGSTLATSSKASPGNFRVYLNHENRTAVVRSICVVLTNPGATPVTVTRQSEGLAETYGDPVKAGKLALIGYENARRNPSPVSVIVPAHGAIASCPAQIGQKGTANQVMNAIIDFHATGAVQVGVVAVDASRATAFTAKPLAFHFADAAHPNGNPKRTYATDTPLVNTAEKGHVRGTFPYDEIKVVLPKYNPDTTTPVGVLLGRSATTNPAEYPKAVDTGLRDNGNYGVLYNVSLATAVPSQVSPELANSESMQVLLNPRGVGKSATVTNGYAGVVDVPAPADGTTPQSPVILTPSDGSNLTNKDLGIGIGTIAAPGVFTFQFMPPGGSTLPLAVVASPAFVKVQAILTYGNGAQVMSDPIIVPLVPAVA